jgi:hypothetical protein
MRARKSLRHGSSRRRSDDRQQRNEPASILCVAHSGNEGDHVMRTLTGLASSLLLTLPLVSMAPAAHADSNDFLGQAQRFLNNGNNSNTNTSTSNDAYERGRRDEQRRQEAARDRERWRQDHAEDWRRGDRYRDGSGSDSGYRSGPGYGSDPGR